MSRQQRKRRRNQSAAQATTQLNPNNLPPGVGSPQLPNQNIKLVQQVSHQHWEAPIPPPALLEQYKDIIPDGPQRIMLMAEQEGAHTRHCQKVAVWGTFIGQTLGQLFAFTLAAGFLYGAVHLAMKGHDTVAGVLGGATVTTIVVSFLQSKKPTGQKHK